MINCKKKKLIPKAIEYYKNGKKYLSYSSI